MSCKNPWYGFREDIRIISLWGSPTSIGDDAFADCVSLEVAGADDALKTIGKCAFKNSGLLNNVFFESSSLTSIGDSAFYGCKASSGGFCHLKAVNPPTLGKDVFSITPSDRVTLYAPNESVEAYKSSDRAKYFVIEGYQSTAIDAVPVEPESRPKVVNGVMTVGGT